MFPCWLINLYGLVVYHLHHLLVAVVVVATVHLSAIVPYIDEYGGENILSAMPDRSALPTFTTNLRTGVPDDVHNVRTQNYGNLQEIPVTYSEF